jgi:transmembrane sensor
MLCNMGFDENKRAKALIKKYRAGICTPEEKAILENWYAKQLSLRPNKLAEPNYDEVEKEIWDKIIQRKQSSVIRIWPRMAIAASVLLCMFFGGYYLVHIPQQQSNVYQNDIPPGRNQATLTLANGQKIVLTKGLNKTIPQQGVATVQISAGNGITYSANTNQNGTTKIDYNTLSTSVGEQSPYPLILADGSKVWLNSRSSITFPTVFFGKQRTVKVTGEALFEVAHNASQPFLVQTEKQTIEDIGTIFNVNAYTDVTKTTLIQGAVKVNGMILKPNEQTDGKIIEVVNARRYIAWKNGDFYFENDNIKTVMLELSRWYNIEVAYLGEVTTDGFNAQISRRKNISEVLHLLESTKGVHFKIEGRRVTVIQ